MTSAVPIGVLGGVGMGLATIEVWTPSYPVIVMASWLHILTGVVGGFGYLALITLITQRHHRGVVAQALSATGQRSLSAYLFQSLVFGALLPAHTIALGATLSTSSAAGLAVIVWMVTVVLASMAATRGWRGPAETLMRRLCGWSPRPRAT